MIEYLYNAIRATAGEDVVIAANITDDSGTVIIDTECRMMLHDDLSMIANVEGAYIDGAWEFVIPADATRGLCGRFWYCICAKDNTLCFKQPIYLI